jgi:carbon-monoxide dehydrogenase small subunit
MSSPVSFTLDGLRVSWTGAASQRLLDVLRDGFGRTGVKCGCREGECGACAVLLDGVLVNSCLVSVARIDGAIITTIDGYSKTDRFKALDEAFAAESAVQCGYCIPGMALAAEFLLSRNPHPSADEARVAISGNLCRCTGYNAIVKAIIRASSSCLWEPKPDGALTREAVLNA